MNELALFAGAGGGILGGHLLGWECVCAVEINDYARRVLLARQRDGMLPRFPIWDDITTFDGRPWRGRVEVVSGGFPCQDISAAGKGAGITGERSGLWSHMARVIGEVGPRFVFVENSPMLISRGIEVVLGDLAALGYDVAWGVIGAHHVGAPHKRDRIWLVGNALCADGERGAGSIPGTEASQCSAGQFDGHQPDRFEHAGQGGATRDVADARCGRCSGQGKGEGEQSGRGETQRASEDVSAAQGRGFAVRGRASGKGRYALRDGVSTQGTAEHLAYASGAGLEGRKQPRTLRNKRGGAQTYGPVSECGCSSGSEIPHADQQHGDNGRSGTGEIQQQEQARVCSGEWWFAEPDVGGASHGMA